MAIDEAAFADRLFAEAVAADLRAPMAFGHAGTSSTEADVERHVRERAGVHREELTATAADAERAIVAAREAWRVVWGGQAVRDEPVRVVTRLSRAARGLLRPDGREMVLLVDRSEPGREILRWRFVTLALPPAILAAAAAQHGSAPGAVRLLHESIAPDLPVAQHHVHHAAMVSFEELWVLLRLRAQLRPGDLWRSLLDERAICPRLHPGPCIGGTSESERRLAAKRPAERALHMAEWAELVLQTFVASSVLEHHTYHVDPLSVCSDPICKEGRGLLRQFQAGRTPRHRSAPTPYPWPRELSRIRRRYREAVESAELHGSDEALQALVRERSSAERSFLVRAFEHLRLDEERPWDATYEALFVQYLRIETAIFRLLVQPPGERGLRCFLEHFSQTKVYVPDVSSRLPQEPLEPGLRVQSVEYRVAPDAVLELLERQERRAHRSRKAERSEAKRAETAWLVHFKRSRHVGRLPLFGASARQLENEADVIERALSAKPTHLRALRGIDLCGVEGDQPLWVSAPTLRHLRHASSVIAGRLPGLHLESLRLTVHAGEEFEWLTSGVRAVAEPFHWRLVERGDRIGHGIAVTFVPSAWWGRRVGTVVSVRRLDRLLDLAFLAAYTSDRSAGETAWLREQVASVAREIGFTRGGTSHTGGADLVETAMALWGALGSRLPRRLMEDSKRRPDLGRPHREWLRRYLWSESTQARAHGKVRLLMDEDQTECNLLERSRERLLWEMARWQVCIESNPSSNLVVAGLDAMGAAQDFLQQRPTRHGGPTLTWTISTDDPITFSTTLADEYAYAWAGMVRRSERPYDPSYARAILDEAAATSIRMRFTLPNYGGGRG